MSFQQWLDLAQALIPVIVTISGIIFKINQDKREEIAHALEYALKRMKNGEIPTSQAKDIILATGAIGEKKADKIVKAMEAVMKLVTKQPEAYKNEVTKGVELTINGNGEFRVDPSGLLNVWAHKITKWAKKKL